MNDDLKNDLQNADELLSVSCGRAYARLLVAAVLYGNLKESKGVALARNCMMIAMDELQREYSRFEEACSILISAECLSPIVFDDFDKEIRAIAPKAFDSQ